MKINGKVMGGPICQEHFDSQKTILGEATAMFPGARNTIELEPLEPVWIKEEPTS